MSSIKDFNFDAQQARGGRSGSLSEAPSLGPPLDFTADSSFLLLGTTEGQWLVFDTDKGKGLADHKLPPLHLPGVVVPSGPNAGSPIVTSLASNPKYIMVVTASCRLDPATLNYTHAELTFWAPVVDE